jgi:hypothetical protein
MSNLEAARWAEKDLGAEIVVIKKTSKEYSQLRDPLPCPSVVVNGRIIVRNNTITQREFKAAIVSDSEV